MGVNKTASSASSAMPISPEILHVLAIFLNVFTAPIREKAQTLIVGALLARCRRAVTAASRQMGSGSELAGYQAACGAAPGFLEMAMRFNTKEGELMQLCSLAAVQ
jgi:hypothetical protein